MTCSIVAPALLAGLSPFSQARLVQAFPGLRAKPAAPPPATLCETTDWTVLYPDFDTATVPLCGETRDFVVLTDPDERAPTLEVEIGACGFRVLERRKEDLAAFFEAKYRFTRPGIKRAKKPRRLFQVGEFRGGWMDFERSPTLAADEFQQVLARAGQTLANRIHYSRGR